MKVVAFNRNLQGTGASRRLRNAGQTPGIIYGGTEAPQLIALDGNALFHALKKEAFHGSVLDMEIDGKTQQVLLRDFQMHAYKQLVLHADFQRVDASQPIHTKVTLLGTGLLLLGGTAAVLAYEWGNPATLGPLDPADKPAQERKVLQVIEDTGAELVVLARYMQVLSDDLCRRMSGRIINIHHSFLPSFKGANPYRQAHARGVKLIGATAHFVTADLDEGPIIEQDVVRVTHRDDIEEMVRLGKDVEKMVLARGLRYHLEDRVLVHDNKTVVFD